MATKKKPKARASEPAKPEGEDLSPEGEGAPDEALAAEEVIAEETRERAVRDSSRDEPDDEPVEPKLPASIAKGLASKAKRPAPDDAERDASKREGSIREASKREASGGAGTGRVVRLKIRRQDAREQPDTRRWEEFEVPYLPQMNVHSALEQIRKHPVTREGKTVAPPVWEASCLEEVCGSCTMLVNGRVRQACSTLVDAVAPKGETIVLEPMSKFPCERDLVVDRSRMFESLKRVKAWIHIDGTHALGPGPRESQAAQEERYPLSRCMTCGSCLEACPQYGPDRDFVGAAALNQVRLMNLHPSGALQKVDRLESVMGDGGVEDCGKAQNCVEVCPKDIPLVDSIASVARDTTKHLLFGWLLK